jgi:DmsE family decaheme c-type cytochrome
MATNRLWPGPLLAAAWVALLPNHTLAAQNSPSNAQSAYAGSETCKACHEDIVNAFRKNPHYSVEAEAHNKWEGKACEACHGPGSKHAQTLSALDILNPANTSPKRADEDCLKCHFNQRTQIGRIRGSHVKNSVPCTACHSVHKGFNYLYPWKNPEVNQMCASCHNNVWAAFQEPFTHKLAQGAMSCTDCHNPHGSFLPWQIKTVSANEPNCYQCHSDLRGPFAFEHPPLKIQGCGACHEPHGSTNSRMLIRFNVAQVCLECHANITLTSNLGGVPPAFHDLRSARFQNCTICHQKIHGSHVDPIFER